MEPKEYMDLLELQAMIKNGIAAAFPGRYWVKAEISSFSPRSNGHCYLSLSQSRGRNLVAEARAMIWKWNYLSVKQRFETNTGQPLGVGITVLVRVQVSYSELYGMSLFIDDIDPAFTLGEKALERKRSIERLQAAGYMELQKELALPDVPCRLALITSKTAAGYQDFVRHLLGNPEGYAFQLDLTEALMQGEQAPASIIAALSSLQEQSYDAILILRGGGSELDLACFDDYELAVAIASSTIPVITAIGHDKDVHIADMVAHQAVKTPTALADLFLQARRAQDALIDRSRERILYAASRLVNRYELQLKTLDAAIQRAVQRRLGEMENQVSRVQNRISRGLLGKYNQLSRQTDGTAHRLHFAAAALVSREVSVLALKEARIKATDPRNILSLGYVLVTGKDHQVLKSVQRVDRGDLIGVRFNDGSLTARVDEIYREDIDNNKTNIA